MADRGVPPDERRAHRNVVMTAAIAGLGGLLLGYDTGIIASALLFVKKDFDLSGFEQGMVVSAVPVGRSSAPRSLVRRRTGSDGAEPSSPRRWSSSSARW